MMKTKWDNKLSLKSVGIGVGVAVVFSLAAVFLGAMLINREYISAGSITMYQIAVYFLSALLGCFITNRLTETQKLIACSITATSYYVVLLATSGLFFNGISNRFWIGIIPVIAALIVFAIWISKSNSSGKGKKRKIAHR